MFYSISIPLIDKRSFLEENTHRININEFPRNWNDLSFLRSFGMFSQRSKPDKNIPYQEKKYAQAHRGVRIANQKQTLRYRKECLQPYCVFRRIFFDDYSARFDIGLKHATFHCKELTARDVKNKVETILKYRVYVNQSTREPVISIGKNLAAKYLYATTKEPGTYWETVSPYWIASATPTVLIELEKTSLLNGNLSEEGGLHQVQQIPPEWDLQLYHYCRGNSIPVWIIVSGDSVQKDMLRALRIYLLKVHQERETLKVFCRLVSVYGHSDNNLKIAAVKEYLDTVTATFSRKCRDGILQQPILDVARNADQSFYGNESQQLLEYLERHLKYLKKRCEKVMEKTFNFNGPFTGNFVDGNNNGTMMQTNNVSSAGFDQAHIEKLLQELRQKIPAESGDALDFEKNAKQLTEEINKEKPDKGVLEKIHSALKVLKTLAECGSIFAALATALGLLPNV